MCIFDCKLCRDVMFGRQVMQEMKGLKDIVHGYRAQVWNIMKPLIDGERLRVICVISNLDMITELDSCMELLWVFAELVILGILGCSQNVHVSLWCAFPCQLDSFGPISTGCPKDLSHGGPALGKMRQQDGLQVRGSLSGRSCHCLVYRDASEYPMPPVFMLGTLRLLDHVSLSLSLFHSCKTKTAT